VFIIIALVIAGVGGVNALLMKNWRIKAA